MPQLETVEDFEQIDKALKDPNSRLSEYTVVAYGYCGYCGLMSVCDPVGDPHHIRCRDCGLNFYPDYAGLSYLYYRHRKDGRFEVFEFMLGTDPEPKHKAEKEFFSRQHQRKLFGERLEKKITDLKGQQRALARQIRRLAKLRS